MSPELYEKNFGTCELCDRTGIPIALYLQSHPFQLMVIRPEKSYDKTCTKPRTSQTHEYRQL